MELYLDMFNKIWNDYYNILPIECYEYDKYIKIINKIRNNDIDLSKCKTDFIDLLEIMSLTIYNSKYYEKVFYEYYDENNNYENDNELHCCFILKTHIKSLDM